MLTDRAQNPCLLHAIVTLTLMHDRYLSADPDPKLSLLEAYHWYRATSSFNRELGQNPQANQRGALLATSALLGCITFFYLESATAEEAWPLLPPSPSDLNWLRMSDGKKEVYKLIRQSHSEPDPLFHSLAAVYTDELLPTPLGVRPGRIDAVLPPEFFRVYNLDPGSSITEDGDDPYQWAATKLAQVLNADCALLTVLFTFLWLISNVRTGFKSLLEQKDARALLLLAWWYARICQLGVWWLSRRVVLEGQAICLYLERCCPFDEDIQILLQAPKAVLFSASP
jgi:hypothetical protein